MTTEQEERLAVVQAAVSWLGTPYMGNQGVKGSGVDCGFLLLRTFQEARIIEEAIDPGYYSQQWHMHKREERYLNWVLKYAHEIPSPPENIPLPGDIIMFKFGLVYAHGAVVTNYPMIIHVKNVGMARVMEDNVVQNCVGKYALANVPKRYFSVWPR